MKGVVVGVILDEPAVFRSDEKTGITHLCVGVDFLFQKLRFSNIRFGVSFRSSFPNDKSRLLKLSEIPQSLPFFLLDSSYLETSLRNVSEAWGADEGLILFVTSAASRPIFHVVRRHGWSIAVVSSTVEGSDRKSDDPGLLHMNSLEELPLTICKLNREVAGGDGVTVVGYLMKQQRQEEFAKRGALPMCQNRSGLIFMPLTFSISMDLQLDEVDLVLHKATDEIVSIDQNGSLESGQNVVYTAGMLELEAAMDRRPDCCVIDRLEKVAAVLDRGRIQHMLHGLAGMKSRTGTAIRPPRFLEVSCFRDLSSGRRLSDAGLVFPLIVKPRVACGLSHAHSMAIVFRVEDFAGLGVPLPAIAQEYVDHSAKLFKIYVLGDKVYSAAKNSIPNSSVLAKMYERNGHMPLMFNSLRSPPMEGRGGDSGGADMDVDLVKDAAVWLVKKFDLTVLGFDIVVEDESGDHVIVDVNYLPSFKEVPDDVGIPAFWEAIGHRLQKHLRSGGGLWRRGAHSGRRFFTSDKVITPKSPASWV